VAVALATLDLFSGIGGFARGFEATGSIETTCFVEQDPYCQAVLRHHWPDVPILGDIRDVKGCELPIQPDVICGGFPCQPFSQAGKQLAQDDPRHLWPEMFRLIRECRPAWIVGENVAGLIKLGLDEVLSDLEGEGYATRTFNLPACAVGAPHIRQRLWIIAHADSQGEPDKPFDGAGQLGFGFVADTKRGRRGQNREQRGLDKVSRSGAHAKLPIKKSSPDVADTDNADRRRGTERRQVGDGELELHGEERPANRPEDYWQSEPAVGRLADGIPNRVSQLRALGNTIIPQIAEEIGHAIVAATKG
jgi:DNA (cytosine-5)-methyltransferase 1